MQSFDLIQSHECSYVFIPYLLLGECLLVEAPNIVPEISNMDMCSDVFFL